MKLKETRIGRRKRTETYLDKKRLTARAFQDLFTPKVSYSDKETDEMNNLLYCESNKDYSEIVSIAVEHKNLLKYDFCNSLMHYLRAIKFISYLNIGYSVTKAYLASHANDLDIAYSKAKRKAYIEDNDIDREAMLFAKSKLVIKLQEVMDYPLHFHFSGYKYEAIEVLRKEMKDAPLPKDRIQAADRLLHHLTPTNIQQNNLIINNNNGDTKNIVDTYKDALDTFVNEKIKLLKNNETLDAKEIINIKIEKEDEDVQ